MTGEVWPCPHCDKVFLEKEALLVHGDSAAHPPIYRSDTAPVLFFDGSDGENGEGKSTDWSKYSLREEA